VTHRFSNSTAAFSARKSLALLPAYLVLEGKNRGQAKRRLGDNTFNRTYGIPSNLALFPQQG